MAWYNASWAYRKQFTVTGTSAGAQTNYQLQCTVNRSAGADSGPVVYVGTKCEADYKDIRFTKSDGTTLLDHWIETSTSSTAIIWVELDSIPSGAGTVTFYMYYGNSGASAVSNIANTFIVGDDFERGNNGDAIGGSWTVVAGAATISTTRAYSGTRSGYSAANAVATDVTIPITATDNIAVSMRYYASTNANIWSPYIGNGSYVAQVYLTGGHLYTNDGTAHDLGTQSTGQWYLIELRNFNFTAHTFDVYRNGLSLVAGAAMASGSSNTNKLYCGNWNSTGYDIWYDNLRVRNFRSVEPTWTSWAAQESNIYPVWRSIGSGIGTGIL